MVIERDINNSREITPRLKRVTEYAQNALSLQPFYKDESTVPSAFIKQNSEDSSKPNLFYINPLFSKLDPEVPSELNKLLTEPVIETKGIIINRMEMLFAGIRDEVGEQNVFFAGNNCYEYKTTLIENLNGEKVLHAEVKEASREQIIQASIKEKEEKGKIERTMRRFTSIIAHDLRAPLTIVLGQAQMSQRTVNNVSTSQNIDTKQISSLDNSMEAIVSAARKMNAQITDIVNILRASDQLKPVFISPKDLLDSVVSENKDLIRSSEAKLFVDASPNLHKVRLEKRIFNLIQNTIILNAVQAKANEIILKAEESDGYIIFTVRDNGTGMNKEAVDTCFMYTGSTTGGSGLMMVLAKETIEEDFGGTISVESEVGKGTTFSISIPTHKLTRQVTEPVILND